MKHLKLLWNCQIKLIMREYINRNIMVKILLMLKDINLTSYIHKHYECYRPDFSKLF